MASVKKKESSEFSYRNDTKKYRNQCKQCVYAKTVEWRKENKEKVREYTNKGTKSPDSFYTKKELLKLNSLLRLGD